MVKKFPKKCGDVLKNITSNLNRTNSENYNNSNSENNSTINANSFTSSVSDANSKSDETSSSPEFDINMIMKMKNIMDSMKTNKNDPRANLLKSLKPYLNNNRKEKVDQYIQLFNMSKIFEIINPLGGDSKKNDV